MYLTYSLEVCQNFINTEHVPNMCSEHVFVNPNLSKSTKYQQIISNHMELLNVLSTSERFFGTKKPSGAKMGSNNIEALGHPSGKNGGLGLGHQGQGCLAVRDATQHRFIRTHQIGLTQMSKQNRNLMTATAERASHGFRATCFVFFRCWFYHFSEDVSAGRGEKDP